KARQGRPHRRKGARADRPRKASALRSNQRSNCSSQNERGRLIKYETVNIVIKKGMTIFPEENDFLSLFECEPMLLDTTSKDLPFYYNKATYRFSNGEEDFIVTLSPSYGEVKIQVTHRT
ncbi:hypothetical protein ABEW06_12670, partial [Peribacillus simplex]